MGVVICARKISGYLEGEHTGGSRRRITGI